MFNSDPSFSESSFRDSDTHPTESGVVPVTEEYRAYVREQLKLPQGDRWLPPKGRRLVSDLTGEQAGKTAFVIGAGKSLVKAESMLQEAPPGSFRIAINAAITKVPAEYWLFIDAETFFKHRDKVKSPVDGVVKPLGVDRFANLFPPEVAIWRRAYEPEDFKTGRLIHRACSLLPALHMAVWLGATRIVTIGCDNTLDPERLQEPNYKIQYEYLFKRINRSLIRDTGYWLPSWVSMADASGGNLALPKTRLGLEIKRLNDKRVTLET